MARCHHRFEIGSHAERRNNAVNEHRRLSNFGFFELLVGSGEHNIGYFETKNIVGLIEHFFGQRIPVIELFAHSDELRAVREKRMLSFLSLLFIDYEIGRRKGNIIRTICR